MKQSVLLFFRQLLKAKMLSKFASLVSVHSSDKKSRRWQVVYSHLLIFFENLDWRLPALESTSVNRNFDFLKDFLVVLKLDFWKKLPPFAEFFRFHLFAICFFLVNMADNSAGLHKN